ncbi:hypothetical protein KIN20_032581 [Parelaphostrongylus tenuis]|uniref:Uncharacterized protein n=1 Tax=Parelaphostrongylus tenuis TaxID=148309 RepID=A0AAD5WHL4_PARTN|nr:hypothetical protein KIN20_032581 [Parelaphostrongylus tenuis]
MDPDRGGASVYDGPARNKRIHMSCFLETASMTTGGIFVLLQEVPKPPLSIEICRTISTN